MAARAIYKGVIRFGAVAVPVKLYSAVEDRTLRFRLLHRRDLAPVKQAMVDPETETPVSPSRIRRAYFTDEGREVLFEREELEALKPEASRDIEVLAFLAPSEIDHRWYDRPYYLGPDGDEEAWAALTEALESGGLEGLTRWVMRGKEYFGALRLYRGYPLLISLRYAEQVVRADELTPPQGKPLDTRELAMSRQLIGMLGAPFEPQAYHDEYRERVQELIRAKQRGETVARPRPVPREAPDDIAQALEASLKGARYG